MRKVLLSGVAICLVASCQTKPTVVAVETSAQTKDTTITNHIQKIPTLVKVPESFYTAMKVEEWKKLTRWCKEFEEVSQMDTKGVEVFLGGLNLQTRVLRNSRFPEKFDIPPLHSRLKVVQMQVQKSKFYATSGQREKLSGALDTLYIHYNAFLNRLLSMADEIPVVATEN